MNTQLVEKIWSRKNGLTLVVFEIRLPSLVLFFCAFKMQLCFLFSDKCILRDF